MINKSQLRVTISKALLWPLFLIFISCGQIELQDTRQDTPHEEQQREGIDLDASGVTNTQHSFLIGTGMEDVTGSVNGVGLMGYAAPTPKANGIHQRLYARAFVLAQPEGKRVLIVNVDTCFIPQSVHQGVLEALESRYGDIYNEKNVLISATHTHAAPGGQSHYHFYGISTGGFSPAIYRATVEGIVDSVEKAHESVRPGGIDLAVGTLEGATRNRSLKAYLQNPEQERARYGIDLDQTMTLLRFNDAKGEPIGLLNWFAIHGTSMKKQNQYISGDNKGNAAYQIEKKFGMNYKHKDGFIAAFANSAAGDATPNTAGNVRGDDEWECEAADDFLCTQEAGTKQAKFAESLLYSQDRMPVESIIDYRQMYVDFSKVVIEPDFSGLVKSVKSCAAGIGLSMLAGSQPDGQGVGRQGSTCGSGLAVAIPFCINWKASCQGVKPVVLDVGNKPIPWTPEVLPIQIIRLGNLGILSVPAEFTTMAGRRLRETVEMKLAEVGVTQVVIAGYANAYAGYVTTNEEYQIQWYEGASTHFGPFTLNAYQQSFHKLAESLVSQQEIESDLKPRKLSPSKIQLGDQGVDRLPRGKSYGQTVKSPNSNYNAGETIKLSFYGGRLNHQEIHKESYFEVQKKVGEQWVTHALDGDWSTKLYHERKRGISVISIEWAPEQVDTGHTYRIVFKGQALDSRKTLVEYSHMSKTFSVN